LTALARRFGYLRQFNSDEFAATMRAVEMVLLRAS